ncbi:hypothetical protein [Aquimarina muelleri]|uniref:Uncharacterized protein n=1 Tax=Aquimarina muelleri TaxID=279356 RepID=A0A918N4Q9_9FLAO|nr:hypothetical protein [Aquimarina muelleri]MCX2764510.1 hypothetical protein [Aquimarina muelleri]GGX30846.1 hypothetical protein GCM10007384_34960 [Aquimarina muelleri]
MILATNLFNKPKTKGIDFKKVSVGVLCFLCISCKKETQPDKIQEQVVNQKRIVQEKTVIKEQDSIRVFRVFLSKEEPQDKNEKISVITKKIQAQFVEYPFESTSKELEESIEKRKEKSFLKTLARDFKNKDFLEVSSVHYSYIVPEDNKGSSYISVEQWDFKDLQKAKSCFESLKKYEEVEIYFKTINWIWVHQDNTIYLVFALDYQVTAKEMQRIKQEIINVIKPSGEYQTIQFYE